MRGLVAPFAHPEDEDLVGEVRVWWRGRSKIGGARPEMRKKHMEIEIGGH
jgi:hypothetical protein